jgi:hypothetical protein
MWYKFRMPSAVDEVYMAGWRTGILPLLALNVVALACWLGKLLWQIDRATFIDGKFVTGEC